MANATPNLSYQNKFSTTLSSGITASDTTIPLTSLPTPSEGYLVIEPDSSTAWEVIYYTSKTGSAVVVPSVAVGRGVGGSTAASHSQNATVRSDSTAEMFTSLQDATGLTGLHRYGTDGTWFDYVASGCVWTGDSLGSTRAASMTSGVAYINGRRHTVAAVTSRTFTASKDTYIDLLYSTVDNVATPVYTEVTNNAASPALASNSIRIGIIITGATTIADAGSINQGQVGKLLPIVSSQPYESTDSLGNLICPRDPQRRNLGARQNITNQAGLVGVTDLTGLSVPVIVPANRRILVTGLIHFGNNSANALNNFLINEGATTLNQAQFTASNTANAFTAPPLSIELTPTAGLHTYKLAFGPATTGTGNAFADGTYIKRISVDLI